MAIISYLVEGEIDEAAAIQIIKIAGHEVGIPYGKKGCSYIERKIAQFNQTAQEICYLALVDFMDTKNFECPAEVISAWLPHRNNLMIFRVVVREIESWLMADRENLAKFLNINIEKVPLHPEVENDPKQKLVNLARGSRSSKIRNAFVPEKGSTAQVGKLYTLEIKRFISDFWNLNNARENSPSLDKCLLRLENLNIR